MVAADARTAIPFSLSPGQAHEAPAGRQLLNRLGQQRGRPWLIMDRAYQGAEPRPLVLALGDEPVLPPFRTRLDPWEYHRERYKRHNGFRRIFSRFEKHRLRAHSRWVTVVLTRPSLDLVWSRFQTTPVQSLLEPFQSAAQH